MDFNLHLSFKQVTCIVVDICIGSSSISVVLNKVFSISNCPFLVIRNPCGAGAVDSCSSHQHPFFEEPVLFSCLQGWDGVKDYWIKECCILERKRNLIMTNVEHRTDA